MESKFPCSGCGACCKRVDKLTSFSKGIGELYNVDLSFPFKFDETGRCEKLTDKNQCSVYEERPLICNIEELGKIFPLSKQGFFDLNKTQCNKIMDEDGIPIEFRI
jgi:Fe-S-cluster containining protein